MQLLSYTFAFHSTAGGFPTLLGSQQRQQTTKTNQKKKTRERFSFPIILATNLLAAEAKTGRRVTMYIGTSLGR